MANDDLSSQLPSSSTSTDAQSDISPKSFWFADGSVIVSLSTDRFKLHKPLLTEHSPFLASLPTTHVEGQDVPVMQIPDGLADVKDFTVLLENLYNDVPVESAPLPCVSSLLRVSSDKTLRFPSVYARARDRFRALLEPGPGLADFTTPEDPEEALGLAVEHDIPTVQKALYYSVATTSHFEADTPHPRLPAAVTARCAALQEQLIAHFTPLLFTVATAAHMGCTDVFAEQWMPAVIAPALAGNGLCRPVETLREIQRVRWEELGLCAACCAEKRAEWEEEVRVVWDRVGEWLGI